MARIKLGPNVTDIRGTIKEMVYSIWKSGVHYIRSKAGIISNPQSEFQSIIRNMMALASKHWYDTLTPGQRENWNEFASGLEPQEGDAGGILNIIPQNRGIMSGFNAYAMCYTLVRRCDIALPGTFDDSPLGLTPPSAPVLTTAVWTDPPVTIEWTDPETSIVGSKIRVWMRSHEKIAHAQLIHCYDLAVLTAVMGGFRGASGAGLAYIDAPGHYIYQLDCIQPNGLKSPPSNTLECIVT